MTQTVQQDPRSAGALWIDAKRFAAIASISERKAQAALKRCHEGGTWRGVALAVVTIRGRGGKAGLIYLVDSASLPQSLQSKEVGGSQSVLPAGSISAAAPDLSTDTGAVIRCNATEEAKPVPAPDLVAATRPKVKNDPEAAFCLALIQPIRRGTAPGSAERAALIKEVASNEGVSPRAIYGWIRDYEAHGFAGLMRRTRKDKGRRRVIVSRAWDDLATGLGLSEAEQRQILGKVQRRINSLWRSGAPSWPAVQLGTLPTLMELTRAAGCTLPEEQLRPLCTVPRALIETGRRYRVAAICRKDAGQHAARQVPRIRRDRSHLKPMEWVAADVHHLDICFARDDGTLCTIKGVFWMDLATNRTFADLFLIPKGQMIRREHVIQSSVHLCSDPNWGPPSRLYADRGGEYNWADLISDLSKVKHAIEVRDGGDLPTDLGVHRAQPYRPQSKVIEGLFANLERSVFPLIPGHIGGDRIKKKTQNQGKAPLPYPGDFEHFKQSIANSLAYYHAKPQSGHLQGKSPNERFAEFVAAGWKSITLDPAELAVAFSREIIRSVDRGEFTLDGTWYRHDALLALPSGSKILVRQPLFGDTSRLFVFNDDDGAFVCIAEPSRHFDFGEPRGAGEQQRRTAALSREIKALEAQTDRLDLEQVMAEAVAVLPPAPAAPCEGVIRIDPQFRAAAQASRARPARPPRSEEDAVLESKLEILGRLARGGR